MKKARYNETQIIKILHEVEGGRQVKRTDHFPISVFGVPVSLTYLMPIKYYGSRLSVYYNET